MREANQAVERAAEYLNGIPKFSREKHSMEDLRTMVRILGAEPEKQKIIHVAGTNGKGSVCAFLASILREAGYHTAVFTSPHLLSVKERFCFDGTEVSDEIFLEAYQAVIDAVPEFERAGAGHPTYFEYLFLMFMRMLSSYPVDYVILETGLGGRLDATNCIEHPALSVITSISLDHMEYLGSTVAVIAGEKAGIIKPGVPVIYDDTSAEASEVIWARAKELGSAAIPVGRDSYEDLNLEDGNLRVTAGLQADFAGLQADSAGLQVNSVGLQDKPDRLPLMIPFAAEYQAVNAMLAVRAAQQLQIPPQVIAAGIRNTVWPGRMEEILDGVYIDGAHNEGGIREFARAANRMVNGRAGGRKILLFAVVSDKEYREMAGILCREFEPDLLILTQIQYGRGLDIHTLEKAAREEWNLWLADADVPNRPRELRVIPTVRGALREAVKEKRNEDTVFCAGSLYFIGEIKEVMKEENFNE